jgi:hypothetical protein
MGVQSPKVIGGLEFLYDNNWVHPKKLRGFCRVKSEVGLIVGNGRREEGS